MRMYGTLPVISVGIHTNNCPVEADIIGHD